MIKGYIEQCESNLKFLREAQALSEQFPGAIEKAFETHLETYDEFDEDDLETVSGFCEFLGEEGFYIENDKLFSEVYSSEPCVWDAEKSEWIGPMDDRYDELVPEDDDDDE